jgi:hypothetical protein
MSNCLESITWGYNTICEMVSELKDKRKLFDDMAKKEEERLSSLDRLMNCKAITLKDLKSESSLKCNDSEMRVFKSSITKVPGIDGLFVELINTFINEVEMKVNQELTDNW